MSKQAQQLTRWFGVAWTTALIGGCLAGSPSSAPGSTGPSVAIDIAALNLQGVGDVVWDVEVVNGAGTPEVVWQRRLASSGYGDGAGSASYVGPCDADPATNNNTVRVWVVGVYSLPVTTVGTFASGGAGGVDGTPVQFQNPTATATPLEQDVVCQPNADASVQFDVALMRPAQQGFFDVAVSFNNIFCSAKFDCCTENEAGGACASDIRLLFDAGGARAATMVLGLACTAGPDADVTTNLYLDALQLDCTNPTVPPFAANITLNPSGTVGNQCAAGGNGMTACTGVVTESGVDADTYLFQMGVYRGEEALASDGVSARKVYWNVALGVKRPAIASCWLKTRGTADDANGTPLVTNGTVASGTVYPYVQWDVNLATCKAEPLTFNNPTAMVRPEYTATGDDATGFAYGFAAGVPAGPFCSAPCENGGQCVAGACACATGFSGATCSVADGGGGGDGFTTLLLHLDGTDGSTSFVDSSPSANPQPTLTGAPQLSTVAARFGTASARFDGASRVDFPSSSDWNFGTPTAAGGTGDFTIDFWMYVSVWTSSGTFVGHGGSIGPWSTLGLWFGMWGNDGIIFQVGNDNSNYVQITSPALSNPTGVWHHIAATRYGTTYTLWVDGVGTVGTVVAGTVDASNSDTLRLGYTPDGGGIYLDGYLDEVRVSKGVARWTADFTPPTAPY